MLGFESERRLKSFLTALGEGESMLERARQRLCEIRDFAPFSAFQRIDRDCNGAVTAFELLDFLRENKVYAVNSIECQRIVKFFDSNEDGRLSFEEFE